MWIMVEILTVALAISNNVPPMDPVMILLTSHSRVLASNMDRNRTPLIVKIATVAMHEPITGSQPTGWFLANTAPKPRLTPIIAAPRNKDRYRSARNDRNDDRDELAEAGRFPNRMKCKA